MNWSALINDTEYYNEYTVWENPTRSKFTHLLTAFKKTYVNVRQQ